MIFPYLDCITYILLTSKNEVKSQVPFFISQIVYEHEKLICLFEIQLKKHFSMFLLVILIRTNILKNDQKNKIMDHGGLRQKKIGQRIKALNNRG